MFSIINNIETLYPPLYCSYIKGEERVINFFNESSSGGNDDHAHRYKSLAEVNFPVETLKLLHDLNRTILGPYFKTPEKKLKDKRTVFVITGQQPGLLAGPLFNLYKALTAVKFAEKLESKLKIPVQPLFWVAGDDHNIPGLLRIFVPAPARGGPVKIHLPFPHFGPPASMVVPTQDSIDKVICHIESLTADSDYKSQVMEILREKSNEPGSLGKWFMNIMSVFFARHGLLFFDPMQASSSGLYTSLLLQVLEEGSLIHERIADQDEKITGGGFPLQVVRTGQESFIMVIWNGRRYALYREKERFVTRGRELSLSRKELQDMIRQEPQRFSPNVFLRPVFQDRLFPNMAYVPGPGEVAYFAQISGVYELFGLTMPPLHTRLGVTLVEPEIEEHLRSNHLSVEEVIIRAQRNRRIKTSSKTETPVLEKLRENLWPRSMPQERVLNIIPYLIKYGFHFWEKFCEEFPVTAGHYSFYWGKDE